MGEIYTDPQVQLNGDSLSNNSFEGNQVSFFGNQLSEEMPIEMNEHDAISESNGYDLYCQNQPNIFEFNANLPEILSKSSENVGEVEQIQEIENIESEFGDSQLSSQANAQKERKKAGRKRKFTPEEDELLLNLIKQHGESKWSVIAEQMPGKNRKQVREHYINFLSKRVNEKSFTPSEDIQILQLIEANGRLWNKIAEQMPGRTALAIKNRYYSKLLKKSKLPFESSAATKNYINEHFISIEEERNTRGSASTNERSSQSMSGRTSLDSEPANRRPTIKGRKSAKQYRAQIELLQKQKAEIQQALNNVTQKIQSMQLTYQG